MLSLPIVAAPHTSCQPSPYTHIGAVGEASAFIPVGPGSSLHQRPPLSSSWHLVSGGPASQRAAGCFPDILLIAWSPFSSGGDVGELRRLPSIPAAIWGPRACPPV